MIRRVIVSRQARVDAFSAYQYIAEKSQNTADRWLAGFDRAVAQLARHAERHPVAEDATDSFGFTVRQVLYGKKPNIYRLLFEVEEEIVNLIRVRHGARGPIDAED